MTKITTFLQVIICLKFGCQSDSIYQSAKLTNDNTTVLLGGLFPVHSNSECDMLLNDSVQLVESMAHTINRINNDSTLLPGIKLAFSIRDTCSTSTHGLDQAFDFVQKSTDNFSCNSYSDNALAVSGVVGAHFSRVSIYVANLLRLYRIPQISYISTADVLGDKTRFDYFFRTVPPDSLQSRAIADIIIHFNWTFVFALYSDDEYGNGGITTLIEHLESHNKSDICIAERIPLSVDAEPKDYDIALQVMSQEYLRNATVAVLFGHPEAAQGMMDAILRAQKQGDHTFQNLMWLGTDSWGDSLPARYHHVPGGILSVIPRASEYYTFDHYFRSLEPDTHFNCWFKELREVQSSCNASIDACMQNNFSSMHPYKQASHLTLVADAVLAFAHAIHGLVLNKCPNGDLCDEVLESRLTGTAINGTMLREQLYNVSFKGYSTNTISFPKNRGETGTFSIKNLKRKPNQNKYSFETVGSWESELLLLSDIQWPTSDIPKSTCSLNCSVGSQRNYAAKTQCCWSCSPCLGESSVGNGVSQCRPCQQGMMPDNRKENCIQIPLRYLSISNMWSILLLIFTLIGLALTLCVMAIFLVCHKHRVIKASSREVSAILLVGLALCYTLPFFFVSKPSPVICAFRRFGIGFSFAVCFSALLIKTNRIYRLFNQKTLDPTKPPRFTSPFSQVVMTLIIISIQVLAIAIWLAVDNPSTHIAYGLRRANLRCSESPVIYIIISLGYNFILLVLSTYNAFLARKVPENFNEAKYINVTLYSLCIIWLASTTTYFATLDLGPTFQAASLIIAIILSATTILVCIFIPKMVLLLSVLKRQQKEKQMEMQLSCSITATQRELTKASFK